MKKIKSLMNVRSFNDSSKVYDKIFKDSRWYVNTKLKVRGIHDVISNKFFKDFHNKNVLDIGCGYGRFGFIINKYAKKIIGIDRNDKSIEVANELKRNFKNNENLEFINSSLESFKSNIKFDFILLSGTLEHIVNTDNVAKNISSLLNNGGVFVSDSPSEFNSRGLVHGSLWKLFNFPMTLTDVDIITPKKMKKIFSKYGITISDKNIGTLYSRAWGKNSLYDLVDRLPKVQQDLPKHKSKMDFNSFFEWYEESSDYFEEFYKYLINRKIIKKIKPFKNRINPVTKEFRSKIISKKDAYNYMDIDFSIDPYYCDSKIFSSLSGNIIYYGKKSNKIR